MAQTTPKNSGYTIINGSTTGKNGAKVNTWLEYKVTQSIANNTSTIDVYLYARANTSGLSTSWDDTRSYGSITFDGSSHAGASISGYDFRNTSIYNEFAHYSQTVTHDSTGKKTITLAGTWDKGALLVVVFQVHLSHFLPSQDMQQCHKVLEAKQRQR